MNTHTQEEEYSSAEESWFQEVEGRSLVVQVEVEEASSAQRVEYRQDPSEAHQQRADAVCQRETEDSEQQEDALQHRERDVYTITQRYIY